MSNAINFFNDFASGEFFHDLPKLYAFILSNNRLQALIPTNSLNPPPFLLDANAVPIPGLVNEVGDDPRSSSQTG